MAPSLPCSRPPAPQASDILLLLRPLRSWECTLRHTLPAPWVAAWLAKPTTKAAFMAAVMAKSLAYEQQRDAGGAALCTQLALKGRTTSDLSDGWSIAELGGPVCCIPPAQDACTAGSEMRCGDACPPIPTSGAALEEGGAPVGGWNACDALAALLAVCDEALLEAEPRHCTVELQAGWGKAVEQMAVC